MPTIKREIRAGEAWQVGEYQITPQNQVFSLRLPGHHAGIIWNRPKAVHVRSSNGQEMILPIRDVTRLAIWSMLAGGFLGAILMSVIRHRK